MQKASIGQRIFIKPILCMLLDGANTEGNRRYYASHSNQYLIAFNSDEYSHGTNMHIIENGSVVGDLGMVNQALDFNRKQ